MSSYFDLEGQIIVTDGRLVWGEAGIDAGWMVGEFLLRDLKHFGRFSGAFTQVASEALAVYSESTGDGDIYRFMHLPYAFQALAEAFFTPDIRDNQRQILVAAGEGALQAALAGEAFDLSQVNAYAEAGSRILAEAS